MVPVRAHLHPATRLRLSRRCDIAPQWLCNRFGSDVTVMLLMLGLTVQHQNNRFYFGAISQQRRSRWM